MNGASKDKEEISINCSFQQQKRTELTTNLLMIQYAVIILVSIMLDILQLAIMPPLLRFKTSSRVKLILILSRLLLREFSIIDNNI